MSTTNENIDEDYQEEWLSAYLDDELTPQQRAIVEQRLKTDQATEVLFNDLSRIRGLVGTLPDWSGGRLAASVLNSIQGASQVATEPDFHDELKPLGDSDSLVALSTTGTLARDSRQRASEIGFDRPRRAAMGWLRPFALVATVLLAVGVGYFLWQGDAPWSLASVDRTTGVDSQTTSKAASPESQDSISPGESLDLPLTADGFSSERSAVPLAATRPAEEMSLQAPAGLVGGLGGGVAAENNSLPAAPAFKALDVPAEKDLQIADLPAPTAPTRSDADTLPRQGRRAEPNLRMSGAEGSRSLPRMKEGGQPEEPAPLSALNNAADKTEALQILHSHAWQAAEVKAKLAQIAPLLGLRLAANQTGDSKQSAVLPVAIVSRGTATSDSLWQSELQRTFSLTEMSAQDLGVAKSAPAPTMLLFVTRTQSEQLLKSASEASERMSLPVWITPAAQSQSAAPNEKVVLVINPL